MKGHPELTPLTSSVLDGYAYNPNTRELRLAFKLGGTHVYPDVPAEKVEALKGSASPGRYFHKNIRDNFKSTKVG